MPLPENTDELNILEVFFALTAPDIVQRDEIQGYGDDGERHAKRHQFYKDRPAITRSVKYTCGGKVVPLSILRSYWLFNHI
jgi:hypothetical protein